MPDMSGKTLGKYRLVERLGRGGMAEVYRAYQPSLDRDVAVKVMYDYMVEDEEFVGRFGREAKAVASLHHPHIVQVYDFDVEDGVYFMVMEYISGETLKARLERLAAEGARMSMEEVVRVFRALCEALDYAHAQGCVHRDIKPANVMFEGDRLMLTDFGLATIVGGTRFTVTGAIIGTPAYMSPEQGRGEPGDARSDIYALGIMLYEVLTGQVPYDADTPLAIVYKHLNEPLPLPSQVIPDLPPAVERVVLKALAKNPEDRYQSAGALAEALSAATAAAEASVGERPVAPRLRTIVSEPTGDVAPVPAAELPVPVAAAAPAAPAPAASAAAAPAVTAKLAPRRAWLPWVLVGGGAAVIAVILVVVFVLPALGGVGEEPGAVPLPGGAIDPQALAHYEAGVAILLEEFDAERALPELTLAIELAPGFAEAYHMRGLAHYMMGDLTMAESDYNAAIDLKPDLAEAYLDRGRLYLHDLDRPEAALADLSRAIELNPELVPAYVERAQLYKWTAREELAAADLDRALELAPDLPEALVLRGEIHYDREEYAEAIPYFARAVEVAPEDTWPWEALGHTYYLAGEYERALATYGQALGIHRDALPLYYGRGFVHLAMGNPEAALEDFGHVVMLDPAFIGAYYGRGRAYAALGRYQQAIEDFTHVIESGDEDYHWPYFPEDNPLVDRAWAFHALGRVDEAMADLDALVAQFPEWHVPYYQRGLLHKALGQVERARADLRQAWQLTSEPEWQAMIEEELSTLEE